MAITLKYELNSKPKEDGTYHILLRVTANRKTLRLGTGQFVLQQHWNPKANDKLENWIHKKADDQLLITTELRNKFRRAQAALIRLANEEQDLSADKAKEYIKNSWDGVWKDRSKTKVIQFINSQIDHANASGVEEMAIKFIQLRNDLVEHLAGTDLPISSVNLEFLHRFETYLLGKNERTTIGKKMKFFRSILKKAIDYGYIESAKNPFEKYTFKVPKTTKPSLAREEIKAILDVDIQPGLTRWHARNIFALQYFGAGTRIGDMLLMRWQNVVGDRLIFRMGKTGKPRSIQLSPEASKILDLYRKPDSKPDDFIFPFLKNGLDVELILSSSKAKRKFLGGPTANINKGLKEVASMAGVTKNISTHIARHSFARHALKATHDVYVVSKALGHSSLRVTEEYLESLDDGAVDQAINMTFSSE